ncbi:MAG: hypothetical protein Q8R35_03835 [bacterium]|nr:hypothetical protein [bacterium]
MPLGVAGRIAFFAFFGAVAAACAPHAGSAPVDIFSALCRSGRPIVATPVPVAVVFQRLLAVAVDDIRGTSVQLVVVASGGKPSLPAWSCGSGRRAMIVLPMETIEDPRSSLSALAHITGHELAHIARHHPRGSLPDSLEEAKAELEEAEAEADERAVMYLARAGYDCSPLREYYRDPARKDRVHLACERLQRS